MEMKMQKRIRVARVARVWIERVSVARVRVRVEEKSESESESERDHE
jgi:hypothetical protein